MKSQLNRVFSGILLILFFFSLSACAKKHQFLTSSTVPAARGYVKINQDKNKNFDTEYFNNRSILINALLSIN